MARNLTETLKLTAPTVHLNGSDADELYRQLRVADKSLHFALEKLYEAAPNARDYYVQGDGAFEAARKEHTARLDKLITVRDELLDLINNVLAQRDARKAVRS